MKTENPASGGAMSECGEIDTWKDCLGKVETILPDHRCQDHLHDISFCRSVKPMTTRTLDDFEELVFTVGRADDEMLRQLSGEFMARQFVSDHRYCPVKYDRGRKDHTSRIYLHCQRELPPPKLIVDAGKESASVCGDGSSVLTFLELSWGGECRGRVDIRLLGNTVMGHHFRRLCTGEEGISFRNTFFHGAERKNRPGESIRWWSGNLRAISVKPMKQNPTTVALKLPVTDGLVSGEVRSETFGFVFRIYTKDSHGKLQEETAFGTVEHGLDILQYAVNLNAKDVIIYECGIVLEDITMTERRLNN
ncbi:uncharacterized protein LOC121868691 [Homarus americanus]|uniref:uncharacterized protein LOC121868691 n=1 Tax=Homarus americanus TaxID=6706 RepID=UPI001C493E85|nr:uncharacterized protein LOC121868691 [Homarus americanus]